MTKFVVISIKKITTATLAPIEMTSFLVAGGAKRNPYQKDIMESGIKLQIKKWSIMKIKNSLLTIH